jgi:putative tricarboxylic transport membrane protein
MEFIDGLLGSLTLTNLMFGLLGSILGTLVGVLPGIGPALAITLLLPITFTVEPTGALIMFAAIYYGAMYGGSTTSILLNAPGESGSVMTTIEGNKMARSGRAGAALATAAIGSFFAGAFATGLLAVGAPFIADLGLRLTPADFFALMVLALGTISAVMGQSVVRGLISLSVGLAIGFVGLDVLTGAQRLTFGNPLALDGISTVIVIVSLFAVGEALYVAFKGRFGEAKVIKFKGRAWMTKDEWSRSWWPWARGAAIGFPLGVLPAGGSELPTFLSYNVEKKLSEKKEKGRSQFGKGAIEGVAGPEAANNANAAGALVPLLALGIPTSATAAVMLASFDQFNIQAGPLLFVEQSALVWTLIGALFIGNFLLLLINLPLIGLWVKLLKIPPPYLYAGVLTLAMLGAFAVAQNTFGMGIAVAVGILGLLFRRYGYPITPLILGVVIGPMAEQELRRAVQITDGEFMTLIEKPFSVVIYSILILGLIVPKLWPLIKKRLPAKTKTKAKTK